MLLEINTREIMIYDKNKFWGRVLGIRKRVVIACPLIIKVKSILHIRERDILCTVSSVIRHTLYNLRMKVTHL